MSDQPEIAGFRIQECVGKGGMATVYLAYDTAGMPVAIKAINAEQPGGAALCEQFSHETSIIGRLRNASLVRIYSHGSDGPWHYQVSEYLPGGDLKSRIRTGMTVDAAVDVTRRLAGALDVAHEAGLVHQDVKPENVLFRSNGVPVLLDFGIASQAGAINDGVRGTPLYMSPEQVLGQSIDRRTDIYSLGCLLYEMLTGSPPYPLPSMQAMMYAHVHKPVPTLPADLASVQGLIDRMMCKDINGRVGSAKELVALLDAHWLLAPERTGDYTRSSRQAFAPDAKRADTVRLEAAKLLPDEVVTDPWQESYELARTYLEEGDVQSGRALLFAIAEQARGEVAQMAKEMLFQLASR